MNSGRTNFPHGGTGIPPVAGAYPWIDKTTGVYGILLAHVGGPGVGRDHFSGFYTSPVLAQMTRAILASKKNPKNSK